MMVGSRGDAVAARLQENPTRTININPRQEDQKVMILDGLMGWVIVAPCQPRKLHHLTFPGAFVR